MLSVSQGHIAGLWNEKWLRKLWKWLWSN